MTAIVRMPAKKRHIAQQEYGISLDARIDAVLYNPDAYRNCGVRLRPTDPTVGGRPQIYSDWLLDICIDLAAVYGSARALFTAFHEDRDKNLWARLQEALNDLFPDNPAMRVPATPPTRSWYCKRRGTLSESQIREMQGNNTAIAATIARETGLCDPEGAGSHTHPDLSRTIYGDGKVMAAPSKYPEGSTRKASFHNTDTGEITEREVPRRTVKGARVHRVAKAKGDERRKKAQPPDNTNDEDTVAVNGCYFVHTEVRGPKPHQRLIAAVEPVPAEKGKNNSEVHVLEQMLLRIAPQFPGVHALTTDGVLHGENIDHIVRATGWAIYAPIAPARKKKDGARVEKESKLRDEEFIGPNGIRETVEIWTKAGRLCQRIYAVDGTSILEPLDRTEVQTRKNLDGTFRQYVCYAVPNPFDNTTRTIRERILTDPNQDGPFNRSENVRAIPEGDPDARRLKGRRQDAESINRGIDDAQPLGRARGWSDRSQLLDLIGHARAVNSLTRYLYGNTQRKRRIA